MQGIITQRDWRPEYYHRRNCALSTPPTWRPAPKHVLCLLARLSYAASNYVCIFLPTPNDQQPAVVLFCGSVCSQLLMQPHIWPRECTRIGCFQSWTFPASRTLGGSFSPLSEWKATCTIAMGVFRCLKVAWALEPSISRPKGEISCHRRGNKDYLIFYHWVFRDGEVRWPTTSSILKRVRQKLEDEFATTTLLQDRSAAWARCCGASDHEGRSCT